MDIIVNDPHMPFVGPLPKSLRPGFTIRIRGKVNRRDAAGFSVNLQCGAKPKSDVAMHLNMVFSSPSQMALNCMQNEEWGSKEIQESDFPFSYGQQFEIMILTEPEEFKISLNGQYFTAFAHRLSLQSVSHISIDGDVTLSSIRYETNSYGPTLSEVKTVKRIDCDPVFLNKFDSYTHFEQNDEDYNDCLKLQNILLWITYSGLNKKIKEADVKILYERITTSCSMPQVNLSMFLWMITLWSKQKKLRELFILNELSDVLPPQHLSPVELEQIHSLLKEKYHHFKCQILLSLSAFFRWCKTASLDVSRKNCSDAFEALYPGKEKKKRSYIEEGHFLEYVKKMSHESSIDIGVMKSKLSKAVPPLEMGSSSEFNDSSSSEESDLSPSACESLLSLSESVSSMSIDSEELRK